MNENQKNRFRILRRIRRRIKKNWVKGALILTTTSFIAFATNALELRSKINEFLNAKEIEIIAKGDYIYYQAANDFLPTRYSAETLDTEDGFNQRMKSFSFFFRCEIQNNGTMTAPNAVLSVPLNGFYKIIRRGQEPVYLPIEYREIKIGNVDPKDKVLIQIIGDAPTDDYQREALGNFSDVNVTRVKYGEGEIAPVEFPLKMSGWDAWWLKQQSSYYPLYIFFWFLLPPVIAFLCWLYIDITDNSKRE